MNKLILIFYYNNLLYSAEQINQLKDSLDNIRKQEEDILCFLIPNKDVSDLKVECLNPKLVSKKEYNNAKRILLKIDKVTKESIKEIENEQ